MFGYLRQLYSYIYVLKVKQKRNMELLIEKLTENTQTLRIEYLEKIKEWFNKEFNRVVGFRGYSELHYENSIIKLAHRIVKKV